MQTEKVGAYYWVRLERNDQLGAVWQPARFTGVSGDGDGKLTWDFIGLRAEDGHHFATVITVGAEVVR